MKFLFLLIYLLGFIFSHAQSGEGLRAINGTKLFIKTIGQGEPLLVIHGGPGMSHDYLLPHLERLSKRYYLIFYDQRASGRSAIPSSDSISLTFFADDIDAIRENLGVEKINILCHSWGAIVAAAYVKRHPSHIKHLIFCNPVALNREYDEQQLANQMVKATQRDSTDRSIIIGSKEFKNGQPEAYRKLLMLSFRHSFYKAINYDKLAIVVPSNYATASQALYTGLAKELGHYDFYDDMKSVSFPVLILHGDSDAIPLAASTKLIASTPGSTLTVLKKCGHFAFIDQPGKFKEAVEGFLRR